LPELPRLFDLGSFAQKGLTDFNDFALENARLAQHQLEDAVWRAHQKSEEQTGDIGKGVVRMDSWVGRREIPCEILKETPHTFLVRLGKDCLLPGGRQAKEGQEVYVPKALWNGSQNSRWKQAFLVWLGPDAPDLHGIRGFEIAARTDFTAEVHPYQ